MPSPALGLLTINALTIATYVLIPVQTQYFALCFGIRKNGSFFVRAEALCGLDLLFTTIEKGKTHINPVLRVRRHPDSESAKQ